MPKQPRRPRAIKRGTDAEPERVASRIITAHLDLRQAGLFDLPATWIAPAIPSLVVGRPEVRFGLCRLSAATLAAPETDGHQGATARCDNCDLRLTQAPRQEPPIVHDCSDESRTGAN